MELLRQRAGLYVRVSSQEQALEGVSIEAQIADLRAYARSMGWEIFDIYIDGGYSGGTDDRPEFKRLLGDAKKRRFDTIIVCKLDRFFRNLRLLLNYLHELEQLHVKFVSAQEGLDTSTPYGKFAVQIMGVIAEFERGRIGERVRDSRRYQLTQNHWPGGRTLYGYRWLPKVKKWEIDEKEAEMVRYIYQLYLDENLGMMKINLHLNQEGYLTRLGYTWRYRTLHRILTHPAYKGEHDKGLTMPVLINPEKWEAAQEKRLGVRSVRRDPKNWLLQGLCICGECGHVFNCKQSNPNQLRRYACRGRNKDTHLDGSPRCTMRSIDANELEKAVWRQLKAVMTDHEVLRDSIRHSLEEIKRRQNDLDNRNGTNEKELQEVQDKKERLALVYVDQAMKKEVYEKRMSILKKKENDLLKARSNLDPKVKIELDELERTVAYLEKIVDGKDGKLFLTEIGVWADNITDSWVGGYKMSSIGSWDEPNTFDTGDFRLGDKGPVMRMIDGPPRSNAEVSRQTVYQNIRNVFESLQVRVYVFRDRIEMKGFIPNGTIEVPYEDDGEEKDLIIPSPYQGEGGYRGMGL